MKKKNVMILLALLRLTCLFVHEFLAFDDCVFFNSSE